MNRTGDRITAYEWVRFSLAIGEIMAGIFALCLAFGLAGCDLPPLAVKPTAYHDVSYYNANPIERDRTNAWCGNNPGLAVKIPSCDSADTSGIHAWHRKMGFE